LLFREGCSEHLLGPYTRPVRVKFLDQAAVSQNNDPVGKGGEFV
jgi:hypothetical protein